MKCDELRPLIFSITDLAYVEEIRATKNFQNPHDHSVYKATEVDLAIDELKREHHNERDEYIDWVNRLQKENAEFKAVIAEMKSMVTTDNSAVIVRIEDELRKTQRALWLARGYIMTLLQRDFQRLAYQCNNDSYKINLLRRRNRYYELSEKCLKKAEEYK